MTELEKAKNSIENQIGSVINEINKLEEKYEALRNFKNSLSNSQSEFSRINTAKKSPLTKLDYYSKNNSAIKKYKNGMTNTLDGIGAKVVKAMFFGLSIMISAEMTACKAAINTKNALKNTLNTNLSTIKADIKKENENK